MCKELQGLFKHRSSDTIHTLSLSALSCANQKSFPPLPPLPFRSGSHYDFRKDPKHNNATNKPKSSAVTQRAKPRSSAVEGASGVTRL